MDDKKLSLYKKDYDSQMQSLYKKNKNNDDNALSKVTNAFAKINDIINYIQNMNIIRSIILLLLIIFLISAIISFITPNSKDSLEIENIIPTATLLGNNSLGNVYKDGPYGNSNSNISVAYILGVHPREKGAHQLMEKALKESDALNYKYYLYKINVTSSSTEFSQSRFNGEKLANEYAIPDIINNNFNFAVDVHYSNGYWGISRFVFTPSDKNVLSSQLAHAMCDNFDWLVYYTPNNPTSPDYVTKPLNDGGVAAIVYEAYTEDDNNVTLNHGKEIVSFIDNWNFTNYIS